MNNPNYPPRGGYRPPNYGGYPPRQGGRYPQAPPPGYRPPYPPQQPMPNRAPVQAASNYKAFSIAALVLGILGVVGLPLGGVTFICGVLGIVFGAIGRNKAKLINAPKGLATGGFVCGIVGTTFSLIGIIIASAIGSLFVFDFFDFI